MEGLLNIGGRQDDWDNVSYSFPPSRFLVFYSPQHKNDFYAWKNNFLGEWIIYIAINI